MAKKMIDMYREVYRDKGIPEKGFIPGIVIETSKQLFKGAESGYGAKLSEIDFDTPDYKMLQALKSNIWHFSVAKNYQDLVKLNNLLIDENGKLRQWKDFEKAAKGVVGNSVKYLKTEYNTVVTGAQMARLWQDIQRDKAIFPFLQFQAVMDGHTTELCRSLNDVIVSVDDEMLIHYFPPNHFNCRLTVKKLRRGVPTKNYTLPDIPEAFKNNVGITGEVFTPKNAFIENTPDSVLAQAREYFKRYNRFQELQADENYIDVEFNKENGALKATHIGHNFDIVRGDMERASMNACFKNGDIIILKDERTGLGKKADGTYNWRKMDISSIEGVGKNTIKRALQHTRDKEADIAILYFDKKKYFDEEKLDAGVELYYKYNKQYKFKEIIYIVDGIVYKYKKPL